MNGVTHTEPEISEFVEVDPTGRYGRVCSLSLFVCVKVRFFHSNEVLSLMFCSFLVFLMQYNEILGKGASKTVYEFKTYLPFFACINGYLLDLLDTHFGIWFKCCSFIVGFIEMGCFKIFYFFGFSKFLDKGWNLKVDHCDLIGFYVMTVQL